MKPSRYRIPALALGERISVGDGCWEWLGAKNCYGYGRSGINGGHMAHRAVYEWLVGPIPEGLTLDHLCRNRSCVRPAHLEPVTWQENSRRGFSPHAVNARKTHCKWGHPLSGENLIPRVRVSGGPVIGRACWACRKKDNRLSSDKRRETARLAKEATNQ